jgi:hypothetical protein
MPYEAYPCVWMALLGGCRLHGNTRLGKAYVGDVCYVICIIANKWDLNRIVEEVWNRCEKITRLVPYCNLWQLVLCSDSSMLTFHHSSGLLDSRLNS